MKKVQEKTLTDLEFHQICSYVAERCSTADGKVKALKIHPYVSRTALESALGHTAEYLQSFSEEQRIPNHGFDPVDRDLQLLEIENSKLDVDPIRRLVHLTRQFNEHLRFFKKTKELYLHLASRVENQERDDTVIRRTDEVIDRHGEIRDDASPDLRHIRRELNVIRGQLNGSFSEALRHYSDMDYLDEIRESVVDNRRVLAVKAMYRRKVAGKIMGSSRSGSITYIEPQRVLTLSRKLSEQELLEREEIDRILKLLTDQLRPYAEEFKSQRSYLTQTDVIAAKARLAQKLNAVLPKMTDELELVDAYHPILWLKNLERDEKTYPQTIKLNENNRIIVISGPNAGGKSITLKTVGLLQLMLQSGMLIPVHERSRVRFFDNILTDIGDNQSIDNHLSTYSYRLKNMRRFLQRADERTLFLIDEFGTGSDPELGGALAEAMLEELYGRESCGIITTHYTNLKLLASELEGMSNANMQFDARSLQPVYQLRMGEAGSSFTFEVAQKNGIPYSLINKAKKKVERGKVRFDKNIAAMQRERSELRRTTEELRTKEMKASEQQRNLTETQTRVQQKLEDFQRMYDDYQRYVQLGKKFDSLAEEFGKSKNKKKLMDEVVKTSIQENLKRRPPKPTKKQAPKARKKMQQDIQREKAVEKEMLKEAEELRKDKKTKSTPEKTSVKHTVPLKINDRVRLEDGRATGTIDTIERGKARVNYGMFTTVVDLDKLEKVG